MKQSIIRRISSLHLLRNVYTMSKDSRSFTDSILSLQKRAKQAVINILVNIVKNIVESFHHTYILIDALTNDDRLI